MNRQPVYVAGSKDKSNCNSSPGLSQWGEKTLVDKWGFTLLVLSHFTNMFLTEYCNQLWHSSKEAYKFSLILIGSLQQFWPSAQTSRSVQWSLSGTTPYEKTTLPGKTIFQFVKISIYHWTPYKLNPSGQTICLERLLFIDIEGSCSWEVSLYPL